MFLIVDEGDILFNISFLPEDGLIFKLLLSLLLFLTDEVLALLHFNGKSYLKQLDIDKFSKFYTFLL